MAAHISGAGLKRQVVFWLIALVFFVLFLMVFSSILLPFIAGMALAYFLDPVADRLERWGLSRMMATVVILVAFVILLALSLMIIIPLLATQAADFFEKLPGYITSLQSLVAGFNPDLLPTWISSQMDTIKESFSSILAEGAGFLGTVMKQLWNSGMALVNIVSLFVITPVVAFYLLLDWDRMIAKVDSWVPRDHIANVRRLAAEMDASVAGFVRGQGSICIILGLFYGIGLSVAGLNFGLLIGLFAGLISFIPYVGSLVGLVLSVGVALVQFWPDYWMVILVAGIFFIGQFVEGNILQPKLVGSRVGLHPVWLMFALVAFGAIFGFVGLMIAVPAAAAVGVLVRFALQRYLDSDLYHGSKTFVLLEESTPTNEQEKIYKVPEQIMTPRKTAEQLPLAFGHDPATGRDDLLVAEPVNAAVAMIDAWPHWPSPVVVIAGPVGSGKSHLAAIWREKAGAEPVAARAGAGAEAAAERGPVLIEDADRSGFDDRTLFHIINNVRQHGHTLLITSRLWPMSWPVELPDLRSRLKAATVIEIGEPDDELLSQVIVKLFADRQLFVDDRLVAYIVARMERSLEAAQTLVARLDRLALARGSRITRTLAQEVLGEMVGGEDSVA